MLYAYVSVWKYTGFLHGYRYVDTSITEEQIMKEYLKKIGAAGIVSLSDDEFETKQYKQNEYIYVPVKKYGGFSIRLRS